MKGARVGRVSGEQTLAAGRVKAETLANGPASAQQSSAQSIRKRRSSINVYDQPSSLNSRLRQLETDMLRLDEDRTKLFDDTHSALAQYDLRLNEMQAILKSRQDNVEKYVEDMRLLLAAKEDFERQAKQLNEKHERIQEKFMHRETIVSREIKLLKNKFDALEKNRQFRSLLQKSHTLTSSSDNLNDDLSNGLDSGSQATGEPQASQVSGDRRRSSAHRLSSDATSTIKGALSRFGFFRRLIKPLVARNPFRRRTKRRNNNNKVAAQQPTSSSREPPPLPPASGPSDTLTVPSDRQAS